MAISREDLDAGLVDLSDVVDPGGKPMAPVHPGEHLADLIEDYGLTANGLARALDVPHTRILAILEGKRSVTADTALRLACAFGVSAQFWLNAQASFDLEVAARAVGPAIERAVTRIAA